MNLYPNTKWGWEAPWLVSLAAVVTARFSETVSQDNKVKIKRNQNKVGK